MATNLLRLSTRSGAAPRKKTVRVMITSGGGPGVWGLLHALRNMPHRRATLLVQDPDPADTLGVAFAEERACLPRVSDPVYVERVLETCAAHHVDVLLPVIDQELLELARRRAEFEAIGTRVLIPPRAFVDVCVDKAATHRRLAGTEFLPEHRIANTVAETSRALGELGYPAKLLCARPTNLAGGRGVHVIDAHTDVFNDRMLTKPGVPRCTAEEFLALRSAGPEHFPLIVSEFLPGEELGIDVYAEAGQIVASVIRRKHGPVFHGNPMRIEFLEDAEIDAWVARLIAELGGDGLFIIDARRDRRQHLRLLEINARPGAYIGLSCGRINLLALAIDRLLGDRTAELVSYRARRPAVRGLRVLGDVLLFPGQPELTPLHRQAED